MAKKLVKMKIKSPQRLFIIRSVQDIKRQNMDHQEHECQH